MNSKPEGARARACWFVGATYDGTDDQTPRFLAEGIWENGYKDKYLDLVKSVQVGDRIAIKSTYTRKHGLKKFDNRGQTVSVMAIKAIGTVHENSEDGRTLKVKWTPVDPPNEWYFYTYQGTVWRVMPGNWMADSLIGFAFDGKSQDIDRFRNAPYWRERFGDSTADKRRFNWTKFYEAVADKLLAFKDRRNELIAGIHAIAHKVEGLSNLQDQFHDGSTGPLKDICPFTAMGIFNRGIKDTNRKTIAAELANFIGVTEPIPNSFEGIPILNNQKSWFFGFDNKRQPNDIDSLWDIFSQAIRFADADDADARSAFSAAYDNATQRYGVGWNLTIGLYWIRPWNFPTLDGLSQPYISKKLCIPIGLNGPKGRSNATDYLTVLDTLKTRFLEDEACPVHSFPELSQAAWLFKDTGTSAHPGATDPDGQEDEEANALKEEGAVVPYFEDNILKDGCFIERSKLKKILECLRTKKNLILQGPPGTGKTWLAKRLAFALMEKRDDSKVRAVQFHPNLSYEDFINGWRPTPPDGKLALVDGPFIEIVKAAEKEPEAKFVIVIEEINRGNPAQIFGEMLTLLEADKRTKDDALRLCYHRLEDKPVHIPDNLYVIGTMNIADRSLALVDLALRRRFAFIDLEPSLGQLWHDWVHTKCDVDTEILTEIKKRINAVNDTISADKSLGPQFRVGHSFVTPRKDNPVGDAREWFRQVVDTEISPLLKEYWFDDLDKAEKASERLLEGF